MLIWNDILNVSGKYGTLLRNVRRRMLRMISICLIQMMKYWLMNPGNLGYISQISGEIWYDWSKNLFIKNLQLTIYSDQSIYN